MVDREKVIKGLERCKLYNKVNCDKCPYDYNGRGNGKSECTAELASDALALLKGQEPKPPIVHENSYGWKFYYCPNCEKEFYQNRKQAYCDKCGQAVKWE